MNKIVNILVLALVGTFAASVQAQEEVESQKTAQKVIAGSSIGARVNVVDVETLGDPILGFGVDWDYNFTGQLHSIVSFDYWNKSSGGLADQGVEISDAAIGAGVRYAFDIDNPRLTPFAGAGLALHRFAVRLTEREDGGDEVIDRYRETYQDVEGEIGSDIEGGVLYNLQESIDVIGQVKYRNLLDANVTLDHWSFNGALAYRL